MQIKDVIALLQNYPQEWTIYLYNADQKSLKDLPLREDDFVSGKWNDQYQEVDFAEKLTHDCLTVGR